MGWKSGSGVWLANEVFDEIDKLGSDEFLSGYALVDVDF
jgi:hypothetical protein